MGTYDRLTRRILSGESDAAIDFDSLCQLLRRLGFDMRTKGSHHIFRKEGIEEKINLQKDRKNAKPYQVRQVRNLIKKYNLESNDKWTNTK